MVVIFILYYIGGRRLVVKLELSKVCSCDIASERAAVVVRPLINTLDLL